MDIQKVRDSFPALAKEQVFFDNAGGSQILGSVVDSYVTFSLLCLESREGKWWKANRVASW